MCVLLAPDVAKTEEMKGREEKERTPAFSLRFGSVGLEVCVVRSVVQIVRIYIRSRMGLSGPVSADLETFSGSARRWILDNVEKYSSSLMCRAIHCDCVCMLSGVAWIVS